MKTKLPVIFLCATLFFCTKKVGRLPDKESTIITPSADTVYFENVKLVVKENCTINCHAPSKGFYQGMPVILETDSDLVQRAASIKASVADPVTTTNKRMPEGGTLSDSDVNTIIKWFAKGGRKTD